MKRFVAVCALVIFGVWVSVAAAVHPAPTIQYLGPPQTGLQPGDMISLAFVINQTSPYEPGMTMTLSWPAGALTFTGQGDTDPDTVCVATTSSVTCTFDDAAYDSKGDTFYFTVGPNAPTSTVPVTGSATTTDGTAGPATTTLQMGPGKTTTATTVQLNGNDVTTVPALSKVTDYAVVSGQVNPTTLTGTVTFNGFLNGTCAGTAIPVGAPVAVSGGQASSVPTGALPPGAYSFQAVYSGDGNYQGSTGPCEPFTVAKAVTSTTTSIGCCGTDTHTVAAGSTFTDEANVLGNIGPGGTVSFTLYHAIDCTGVGTPEGGSEVANHESISNRVGPLAPGSWSFRGVFNGNVDDAPSTSPCEALTVTGTPATLTATVATKVQMGSQTVTAAALGSTVTDAATVSGGAGNPTPTGGVSFTFYGNGSCSGQGSSSSNGTLSGGGSASSAAQGPLGAGSYSFQASYGGDLSYKPATGVCESFSVGKATVTIDTQIKVKQNGKVVDKASVGGATASILPTGTISFLLYPSANCTGTPVSAGTAFLSDATSDAKKPPAGSYSFQATYSGDSNYGAVTGPCESST